MHAVVRTYSGKGAKELLDVLEKNKGEVEGLIRAVKGFESFSLVRTSEGGFSVSRCSTIRRAPIRAFEWLVIGSLRMRPIRAFRPRTFQKAG